MTITVLLVTSAAALFEFHSCKVGTSRSKQPKIKKMNNSVTNPNNILSNLVDCDVMTLRSLSQQPLATYFICQTRLVLAMSEI